MRFSDLIETTEPRPARRAAPADRDDEQELAAFQSLLDRARMSATQTPTAVFLRLTTAPPGA